MSQIDIFGNAENKSLRPVPLGDFRQVSNGEFTYLSDFYTQPEGECYFQALRNNVQWKQEAMKLYGKSVNFPRLTAWYGDSDRPYSFSGIILQPLGWLPELLEIRQKLEKFSGANFNSVLLNLYRNGNDSISWHTDAERELGENPVIASVNFGETRKFQLRHRVNKQKIELDLRNGSALIMQGELQHFWQHQVPKTSKPVGERINLTFRNIKAL